MKEDNTKEEWEERFDDEFQGHKNTKFDLATGEVEYRKDRNIDMVVVSKKVIKHFIAKEIEKWRVEGITQEATRVTKILQKHTRTGGDVTTTMLVNKCLKEINEDLVSDLEKN